jgi:hypothetical protein
MPACKESPNSPPHPASTAQNPPAAFARAQGRGSPARHAALYGFLHALHDGLARAGRRGPGRDVGRGEDARIPGARGIHVHCHEPPHARRAEQLVRGAEVGGPSRIPPQNLHAAPGNAPWRHGRGCAEVGPAT